MARLLFRQFRAAAPNVLHNRGDGHDQRQQQKQRLPPVLPKGCTFIFQFARDFAVRDPIVHQIDRIQEQGNLINSNKQQVHAKDNHPQ
jgi:hypothetical protein